ncbi:diguanylate cyclase domain-containing protein [Clostridium lacusfryxellense]|uniref:diguanylate cyclase domain-containing protein n=1 Tax=Clostridium lacusfryxellense TaxID=205328 RepID=UPI001C0D0B6F|nr:diguanylate cyclase [Clostridium lacusfryxellense]MBU3114254.1 diguanylate cyclase [Clostridium lacusfryxellense]
MLKEENIKILLFTILCICFIFYLFLGVYSYRRDKRSKVNISFLFLCVSASLWSIGYAFMLISPNIENANIWKMISAFGWCFFDAIWVTFAFSLLDTNQKKSSLNIQSFIYVTSTIFFINNILQEPSKTISKEAYGYVDNLYGTTVIGIIFNIYFAVLLLAGFVIFFIQMKNTKKNRVKKQMKTIIITSLISFCLGMVTDIILPAIGSILFPTAIIAISIGMGGMWYAINKHKMMSISYELVSEYLFEAVNEPVFIISEEFIVENCNESSLSITEYNYNELRKKSLSDIINFRNFDFNTVMLEGYVHNIEVDLNRRNNDSLICELSATVIFDEYFDILGILVLLHDISEREEIAKIQKKYTLELEKSNYKLKNEIIDRLEAEDKISHFVYYDALTEVNNRKKMLEDVDTLLENKNERFAILFIDLDKFKSANDNYGHEAGDIILKAVATRLKKIINLIDTIYRIGGDEFIIILRNLKEVEDAQRIALASLESLNKAFTYKENQLFIGGSIGISIFPEHGTNADKLINNADSGMYEAKRNGGNQYKIYSSEFL